MRSFFLTFFLLSLNALGDSSKFSDSNYVFRPNSPIQVLEVPDTDNSKTKFCVGHFVDLKSGRSLTGLQYSSEVSECTKISDFGVSENLYVERGTFEQARLDEEKIKRQSLNINGASWISAYLPNVIILHREGSAQNKKQPLTICELGLVPEKRFGDPDRPIKNIFCKAMSTPGLSVRVDNKSTETVCPLPAKCASPEFAIKPVLEMMPGSDDDLTPHALTSRNPTHR